MIQPPCKHYENYAWVECEKRCRGCRDTCEAWNRYQEELKKAHESKNVNRILNDMNHERMYQKGRQRHETNDEAEEKQWIV